MTAVDADGVAAAIEVIEERARRRQRKLVPVFGVIGGVFGIVFAGVGITRHHSGRHHNVALGITVVVAVCLLLAVVLLVVRRRRGRWFPRAPLGYGLTRPQRREVKKDLRCGRPNADPVLAEVERRIAERVLRQSRHYRWFYPLLALVMAVNIVLPDRSTFGRSYFAAALVLFVVAWPFQLRNLRRLRAFPRC